MTGRARSLDVLREALSERERAVEGHLHEDGGELAEPIAARILVEEAFGRRQLPAELEVEPVLAGGRRHLGMRGADRLLALRRQRQGRPDVRRRVEDARAVLGAPPGRAPAPPRRCGRRRRPTGRRASGRRRTPSRPNASCRDGVGAIRRAGRGGARGRPTGSSRRARDSSWRTRSRVTPSSVPTSSSVFGPAPLRPKRSSSTWRMRSVELARAPLELDAAEHLGERRVRLLGVDVLDHVAVHRVAVADGRLQADRDPRRGRAARCTRLTSKPLSFGDLLGQRLAVELLGEDPAGAHDAPHLVDDVDGETDRAALVGDRACHRLADPPGRVRRELVAHLVVELLDRADEAEVALLDQVEERDARVHVVARDRHDEAEVALDQAPLRGLVALVLAPRELALLGRRQERAVADLADVELERILRRSRRRRDGLGVVVLVLVLLRFARRPRLGDELELRLLGLDALRLVWAGRASAVSDRAVPRGPIGPPLAMNGALEGEVYHPRRGMCAVGPRRSIVSQWIVSSRVWDCRI